MKNNLVVFNIFHGNRKSNVYFNFFIITFFWPLLWSAGYTDHGHVDQNQKNVKRAYFMDNPVRKLKYKIHTFMYLFKYIFSRTFQLTFNFDFD